MTNISKTALSLMASLFLGGCNTVNNILGTDHYSPEAWDAAEPSPALLLPPDYTERPKLPPPRPGENNPYVVSTTAKAQKTMLGEAPVAEPGEGSEKEVVDKALESQEVTPDIRKIVDDESQVDTTVSGKVIAKIKSWKKEAVDNLTLSKSNVSAQEAIGPQADKGE